MREGERERGSELVREGERERGRSEREKEDRRKGEEGNVIATDTRNYNYTL